MHPLAHELRFFWMVLVCIRRDHAPSTSSAASEKVLRQFVIRNDGLNTFDFT
eukprot:CAMPEP_0184401280 /NCGR_PEP_ID=MMETSP0007-20130409/78379_1 /TAXON_ID=97485 /ORGANISM="Prymnesium parvum, Strain Texoma1" /LENGTH=51 /DNA_ID=CAMNT_0026756605 /DNA_START=216 /DNA_END=367 /DNA_ORIENTATION=+